MQGALRLLVAASFGATACLGGGPVPAPSVTAPSATPVAGVTPGVAAGATCPPPRAPTYLPWRSGTVTSRVAGTASILRFDGSTLLRPRAAFVLERRADARGFPTSVTEAPTVIMGRETHVLSTAASETEFDAWWEEGTGDCRVYHARLALGGDPEQARTEFANVVASIPAAIVDPAADRTGLLAEIPLQHEPAALAVMPSERRLFVADRDGGVSAVDTTTNAAVKRVALPLASGVPPRLAAVPSAKRVYATDFAADRVLVLAASTLDLIATVPTGRGPNAVAADAAADRVYVASLGHQSARAREVVSGSVTIIDAATSTVVATVPTKGHPVAIDVHPRTQRVYVAALGLQAESSFVQVIDGRNGTEIASVGISPANGLVVDPVAEAAYLFHADREPVSSRHRSKFTEMDLRTNGAATYVGVPGGEGGEVRTIGWYPGSDDRYRRLYLATHTDLGGVLYAYRQIPGAGIRIGRCDTCVVRVGQEPVAIAVDGATHRVYVASAGTKTISVVLQGSR